MPQRERQSMADRAKSFLQRHGGNAEAAIAAALKDLLGAKKRIRELEDSESPYRPDDRLASRNRELESETERLEAEIDRLGALVPAQGAVVLTGDDAKAYTDYKALGAPADLKKIVDEVPTLRTKLAENDTKAIGTQAATLLGWNPEATIAMLADKKLVVSLVDAKDSAGKDIKVPHVRPAGEDKATPVAMGDWVKNNASYLTPSLTTKATPTPTPQQTPTPAATTWPTQTPSSAPVSTGDAVADFSKKMQAARDARPSPFAPRTTQTATT